MKEYKPEDEEYECPECGGIIKKDDLNYDMATSDRDWTESWIQYREKCPHCGKDFYTYEVSKLTSIEVWRVDE